MEQADGTGERPEEPPRCPVCGSGLEVRLVSAKDEAEDAGEPLLLLDCPRDDFHGTATREDVVTALTAAVRKRLGF